MKRNGERLAGYAVAGALVAALARVQRTARGMEVSGLVEDWGGCWGGGGLQGKA